MGLPMVPGEAGAYSIHSRDCYAGAEALRTDVSYREK
jgi:hypothetical protein